jgi:hypothetical protein
MESLYDIDHISRIVPVVLDNSKTWHAIASRAMKLGERGVAHVQGISRAELKENPMYSKALLINRTASPLAWYVPLSPFHVYFGIRPCPIARIDK